MVSCGISTTFAVLSPNRGKVAHALLTRPPLKHIPSRPKPFQNMSPLDLHVLGTPPAFVLSQDQTLTFNPFPYLNSSASPQALAQFPASESRKSLSFGIICLFFLAFLFVSVSFSRFAARSSSRSKELVYHTKCLPICQHFFQNFFKNFCSFGISEQSISVISVRSLFPHHEVVFSLPSPQYDSPALPRPAHAPPPRRPGSARRRRAQRSAPASPRAAALSCEP